MLMHNLLIILLLFPSICLADIQDQLINIQKLQQLLIEKEKAADAQPTVTFDSRPVQVLYEEARSILTNKTGPYDKAIDNLRSIILSQPANVSREAHELLGYAYDKSGSKKKAKIEYELYLSLYTKEDFDRNRVRQRLLAIEVMEAKQPLINVGEKRKPRTSDESSVSGSVSQYVIDGTGSLSGINLNAKKDLNQYSLSSRFRLSELKSFNNKSNRTNLSLAYVELEDTFRRYDIKLGRQYSVAGALGRFDGLSYRDELSDTVAIDFAAGIPFAGMKSNTSRKFIGSSIEWTPTNSLDITGYLNRQTADGILERFAIGSDFYYRSNKLNSILRVEYDTVYNTVNLVSIQATKYYDNFTLFTVYERRRSPLPYADVALGLGILDPNKQAYNSVSELLHKSGLSASEIYSYVSTVTPVASSFVLGSTKDITKDLTLTSDFQITNLSTVPGFNLSSQFEPIPIQVGQSNSYSLNLHLRKENFFITNNSTEFVLNRSIGEMKSYFLTAADTYRFGKSNISTILRFDSYDYKYMRNQNFTGILRAIYSFDELGTLDMQYSRSLRDEQNFYIGYRYDF